MEGKCYTIPEKNCIIHIITALIVCQKRLELSGRKGIYADVGVPKIITHHWKATHRRCCVFVWMVLQLSNHQQLLGRYELNKGKISLIFERLWRDEIEKNRFVACPGLRGCHLIL